MTKKRVVLLPALLCDAGLFVYQIKALQDKCDFYVPDLSIDTDIQTTARRILDALPDGPFALAGVSMGGYVAFELLRQAPDRVSGLCLIDTNPLPETPTSREKRRTVMEQAKKDGLKSVVRACAVDAMTPEHAQDPSLRDLVEQMAEGTGLQGFLNEQSVIMSRPDSRSLLSDIRCPTTVLTGTRDKLSTPETMAEMADRIPNAVHILIDDSAHFPPIENPAATLAAFEKWLKTG